MAKGIGKGNAEGSQRILDEKREGTQFKAGESRTIECGREGGLQKARNEEARNSLERDGCNEVREMHREVTNAELDDLIKNGKTPYERWLATMLRYPKLFYELRKHNEERFCGKPTQVIDNNITGDLEVSKPPIVFKDVESASREGEEERLHSEEEDI